MESYMGMILIWANRFAPQDFATCNGAQLAVQQYNALYSPLGTVYGGSGSTAFNLPTSSTVSRSAASRLAAA